MRIGYTNGESPYIARKESSANTLIALRNEMQLLLAESSPDHESIIDWINKYSNDFDRLTTDEPQLFEQFSDVRSNDKECAAFLKELRKKLEEFNQKRPH